MTEVDIRNQQGEIVEKFSLDSKVFDGKVSDDLMHQAIVTYLANRRHGTASTKTRAEVSGGGKKPWRQKGTGRARVGSNRSPLWKGGGIVFGPKPRDYTKKFPKRMKVLALKSALNAQLKEDGVMVIDRLFLNSHKTKEFFGILEKLKVREMSIRVVFDTLERNVKLASRNMGNVKVENVEDLTTYTVLDCKKLIFTRQSLEKIEKKIRKWLK